MQGADAGAAPCRHRGAHFGAGARQRAHPSHRGTPLGQRVALGCGVFWLARLLIQFFGYSSELWRGKRFETCVHLLFIGFWSYLSTVFLVVGLG